MLIIPYDIESQSRNVLASPLGEEGHEVAKGCTRIRMIMTLDMDLTAERRHYNIHRPLKGKRFTTFCASLRSGAADWRSGPRWSILSVFCPVHPFATTWHFPSRGNEKIGGTGYCVTYDKESQSRNADFILIARRAIPQPSGPKAPSNLRTLGPKAHPS